ncbi:hypothetical protein Aple_051040 [Acrocarpospora pleiomorpha]|uniref:Uncharacterized protein n=1 Tax=Acrocarpospora pleiomorpha TaxID=90975 RepID=A0A5M3XLC0_9ACTN|nr:hypothetical protein [Acrocarpospora pleiomorpha]GES22207.1 hypothetical protein Aple_051040 [Acrocarpospora pleiomorpha]
MTSKNPKPNPQSDPVTLVNALGAVWSPDLDAYLSGADPATIRCALCTLAPCACPPFGTDAYFALIQQRHGRGNR